MNLTDYEILGVTGDDNYHTVKRAYYELSRLYHPDYSHNLTKDLSKEEKKIAFEKIKTAYENLKDKLNVVEIDLPKTEHNYSDDPNVIVSSKLFEVKSKCTYEEFYEQFNNEFEKLHTEENSDNPFSIFYKEPEDSKKNIQNSNLLINYSNMYSNKNNTFEFGVNYVEDHSSENYSDIRIQNKDFYKIKEEYEDSDNNLQEKLDKLILERDKNIELNPNELNFIKNQDIISQKIQISKNKIQQERNKLFLS